MDRWYTIAEDRMGVTRTHGIPGLPGNNNFKVLEAGAKKLGYKEVHTGRMAINSQPRDGRGACQQIGFCFQGCKTGAKWSTLYVEIPKGEKTGNLEVRPNAQVLKIEHDASGKITGVVYADKDGKQLRQKARLVCVAGNSIESPRLLLNSSSSMFPDGLANSSGQVGKNYMRHMTGSVYAAFDKPVHMYRGTTMAGIIQDEAGHKPERGFVGGFEMETLSLGLPFMAAFLEPGAWGKEFAWWLDNYDKMAGMWLVGEDMPQEKNAVTLHATEKDQYGLPVPDIHFDDHANDTAMRNHAYSQGEEVYKSAGAMKTFRTPPYPSTHNLGTNRMSEKPRDGVVDKNGRTHDVKNLFVSGWQPVHHRRGGKSDTDHRGSIAASGRPHRFGDEQGESVGTPEMGVGSRQGHRSRPTAYCRLPIDYCLSAFLPMPNCRIFPFISRYGIEA